MIESKKQWYELQRTGMFNTTRHFTLDEFVFVHGQFPGDKMFSFRNAEVAGAPFVVMPKILIMESILSGAFVSPYVVAEAVAKEWVVVQGEYDGLGADISFVKDMLRDAMDAERQRVTRAQLIGVIGYERYRYLDGVHDCFSHPTDLMKRSVVEFTVFDRAVGELGRDMIVWEVRNY